MLRYKILSFLVAVSFFSCIIVTSYAISTDEMNSMSLDELLALQSQLVTTIWDKTPIEEDTGYLQIYENGGLQLFIEPIVRWGTNMSLRNYIQFSFIVKNNTGNSVTLKTTKSSVNKYLLGISQETTLCTALETGYNYSTYWDIMAYNCKVESAKAVKELSFILEVYDQNDDLLFASDKLTCLFNPS